MPKLSWYKDQLQITTDNLRTIDFYYDIKHIIKFIGWQKADKNYVNINLIKEAIKLLPEINLVFTGKSGYYAGHCIVLPLKEKTYLKLKHKEITNKDLRAEDLVNYRLVERPNFYRYDITGDCNDTIFYVMAQFFRFFKGLKNENYFFGGYTERDDNYDLNLQIGLKVVWEDKTLQQKLDLYFPPRFLEGDFSPFLSTE